MSEEAPANETPAEDKGGLPKKTIVVVLALLAVEAVAVFGAVMMFGKPSEVRGVELEHGHVDEGEKLVEIPVVREKFTNNSSGRVWIWDAEVVLVAKLKHAGEAPSEEAEDDGHGGGHDDHGDSHGHAGATLRTELDQKRAQVRTGIGAIFSGAQHSYFTEPGRETLSRQIREYLRDVFGEDAEGHPRVHEVVIPKCLGFPADY